MIETEHLDADLVAAYLERDLPDAERESVEVHLSACDECCEQVMAIDATLRSKPGTGSIRRYAMPAAAAAAVLVAILVARPWQDELPNAAMQPDVIERTAPDLVSTRIQALSPAQGVVVDPRAARLEWRSAGEGARYQVTISTTEGDSVWVSTVPDTVAAVPTGVIDPNREYLWYVDALLPDGGTASTGVSHFRSGP